MSELDWIVAEAQRTPDPEASPPGVALPLHRLYAVLPLEVTRFTLNFRDAVWDDPAGPQVSTRLHLSAALTQE